MLSRLEPSNPAPTRCVRTDHSINVQKGSQPDPPQGLDQNEVTTLPVPDGKQLVQYLLDTIHQAYPGVGVEIATLEGTTEIQALAASRTTGITLILSPDFLKKMEAGGEAFLEGSMFLDQILAALSARAEDSVGVGAYVGENQAQFWITTPKPTEEEGSTQETAPPKTLFDWIKELQEKAEEQEKKRFRVSGVTNNLMQTYSRLSRANTVPNVKSVISGAQQSIYQLKLAASMGNTKQKEKARALLSQMDRAVARARGKIRALNEEEDSVRRQHHAEKEQERQQAMQIAVERKKRQAARYARENAHLNEALTWSYQQALRERQKLYNEEQQAHLLELAATPVSVQPIAIAPAAGAASVTVAVSEPIAVPI